MKELLEYHNKYTFIRMQQCINCGDYYKWMILPMDSPDTGELVKAIAKWWSDKGEGFNCCSEDCIRKRLGFPPRERISND